ncbi:MAG TPA: xanthine dehydrogenase family protein molybdopterin-binding subunit [Candidatus Deferrimicrobium sp.]|nr:xanthine dehydrogenase family protein molybdopterin-binding subunit [Candidatus Deferrimicrobium sp.]
MFSVGNNVQRIDGHEKVAGKAVYAGDLRLPGMAYGKVLRSPLPHGRIRRIDASMAAALPGVLAVLKRDNLPVAANSFGAYVRDQQIIATDKVRYAGDMVAAVAATQPSIAAQALTLIDVDYEELPAVFSIDDALKAGAPLVHEKLERRDPGYGRGASHIIHDDSNICLHFRHQRGDIAAGFKDADAIFEDTFYFPSAQHYPMEPHVCVAHFEGETLTVWSATQSPFPVRQELARIFALPFSGVRVIVPAVGGGYGAKSGIKTEGIAACLSRLCGRPVRLAFGAEETFKTICQPRAKMTLKTGVKKDGTFVARHCEIFLDGGAYANSGPSVTEKAGYRAHGPYRIPHVLTNAYSVYTNTVPGGAFRGFGGPQVAYAYETHTDMIAQRMAIDPFDLRMKNLLDRGESFSPGDTPIDCDLKAGLKNIAQAIGWDSHGSQVSNGPKRRGVGIATAMKDGGGTNKPANAAVKIFNDGSVLLSTGSVEVGQGMRTAFLQVVAEELSVPPAQVRVAALDTHYTPFDKGTNASSATSIMGQAVLKAARDARRQLLEAAAAVMKAPAGEVRLENGMALCGEERLSFREVMQRHFRESEGEIWGRGYFKIEKDQNVPLGFPSPFWEIGFGAAEVEVDVETGAVKLLRYISLTDAGKMINPMQCEAQDEGAAVFGLGQALFEDLAYQDGQLLNCSLIDYCMPRFIDLPGEFTTMIMEGGGGPGPYGAKGMGEGGILPVAPAIGNAVFAATGTRIQSVPLTPDLVWRAMTKNGKA